MAQRKRRVEVKPEDDTDDFMPPSANLGKLKSRPAAQKRSKKPVQEFEWEEAVPGVDEDADPQLLDVDAMLAKACAPPEPPVASAEPALT